MQVYRETTGTEIDFLTWMTWAIPVVLVLIPIVWLWMTRRLTFSGKVDMPQVGKWDPYETRVLIVFGLTALTWVTRKQPFGGWSGLFDAPLANDASVALLAVVVMFLVPNGRGGKLLDWERAQTIPWGMLILFGGGIAIATAFVASGLSAALGEALSSLAGLHALVMIAVICLTITFLTEVTSNTATTTLLMPILAAAAVAAMIDPRLLMVPAAMSASCAFMLPVATAPNTIMFSTGRFPTSVMAREGFALNLIGAIIISVLCYVLVT